MSRASRRDEDTRNHPGAVHNVSELEHKYLEQREADYSPRRASDGPDELGDTVDVPNDLQSILGRLESDLDNIDNEMNALGRRTGPKGQLDLQEESRVAKGDSDVVDGAEID